MSGYRHGYGERERAAAQAIRAHLAVDAAEDALAGVRDARIARVAGGLTGVLGVLVWPLVWFVGDAHGGPAGTFWMWGTVAASFVAWALTRFVLALVKRPIAGTERQASTIDPWPSVVGMLRSLHAWSIALPLVAASFLGPLFLHSLVYVTFASSEGSSVLDAFTNATSPAARFATWIGFAAMIVPHAHIGLAVHASRFARRLARGPVTRAERNREWLVALGLVSLCGAVPGILLIALPTVITAVTGLALIPLMYGVAHVASTREQVVVDAVERQITGVRVEVDEMDAALDAMHRMESTAAGPPDEIDVDEPARSGAPRGAS